MLTACISRTKHQQAANARGVQNDCQKAGAFGKLAYKGTKLHGKLAAAEESSRVAFEKGEE